MKRGLTILTALVITSAGLATQASGKTNQERITVGAELSSRNARREESGLCSVIADAIRDAANTDIAFVSASSFSEQTIPKGSATAEDFLKALAFRNDSVVVVRLTGEKVKAALEHGLALYPQMHSAFLQVSGITVSIDPKQDREKRVTGVRVGGSALDDKRVYSVAMPTPLADGGLAYYRIWSKSDIDKARDPKLNLEEAVRKYLKGKSSVGDSGDRLEFKK
jgi:2',3'-cyclic-nucleotide 2'-phosphodiesterase (5'-nucleotidase family)